MTVERDLGVRRQELVVLSMEATPLPGKPSVLGGIVLLREDGAGVSRAWYIDRAATAHLIDERRRAMEALLRDAQEGHTWHDDDCWPPDGPRLQPA